MKPRTFAPSKCTSSHLFLSRQNSSLRIAIGRLAVTISRFRTLNAAAGIAVSGLRIGAANRRTNYRHSNHQAHLHLVHVTPTFPDSCPIQQDRTRTKKILTRELQTPYVFTSNTLCLYPKDLMSLPDRADANHAQHHQHTNSDQLLRTQPHTDRQIAAEKVKHSRTAAIPIFAIDRASPSRRSAGSHFYQSQSRRPQTFD